MVKCCVWQGYSTDTIENKIQHFEIRIIFVRIPVWCYYKIDWCNGYLSIYLCKMNKIWLLFIYCGPRGAIYQDDIIRWKHIQRYWPFVQGIHRSLVNSPHKGQWHKALVFSLICTWTNSGANNGDSGDLRRHCAHYNVIVMSSYISVNIGSGHCPTQC